MRKKIFYSFFIFVSLFSLFIYFFPTKSFACDIIGAFDDTNGGNHCESACGVAGAIGINVVGLKYDSQSSTNLGSGLCGQTKSAVTCIYYDPSAKHCVSGTGPAGTAGYNNGCQYTPNVSHQVACPSNLTLTMKVVDPQGNPISGVALHYTEGILSANTTTGTDGTASDQQITYSADSFTITPTDSRYTFQPTTKTGTINDAYSCGTSFAGGSTNSHGPCTFVATAVGTTPGTTITPSPTTSFTPIAGKWVTQAGNSSDGIGVITTNNTQVFLRNTPTTGLADENFTYGDPTSTSNQYLWCDWNGTGVKTPAVFVNGAWNIRNTNDSGKADTTLQFGQTGDIPVCGDWTGQGKQTVGVFRPSNGTWYLKNSNTTGTPDITFAYGASGDIPIVGRWQKNTTKDTAGVIRGNKWLLRTTNTTGTADITFTYGLTTDKFTVGDWTGQGFDTPAAVRDNGKTWLLKNANSTGNPDKTVTFNYNQASFPLTLVVLLPGIGYNGLVGTMPQHLNRPITIELYGPAVTNPGAPGTHPLTTTTNDITYTTTGNDAGYFTGIIPVALPDTPTTNNQYQILLKMPQYLWQLGVNPANTDNTHLFTVTQGQSIIPSVFTLFPGDIYGRNSMGVEEFTQIETCLKNASDGTCTKTPNGILFTDLDDNGVVDIVDMNILLRSLSQLEQAQAPGCSTGACQGD